MDIDRFSTHDGPGIRTTIFLKGCHLACRWCHSPESQSFAPELLYQASRCVNCRACIKTCPAGAISINARGEGGGEESGSPPVYINREKCIKCFKCAEGCSAGALRKCGMEYSARELADSVKPDIPFFKNSGGGVSISGGEPLAQSEFCYEIMHNCRELGIDTLLETSGFGSFKDLERIASVSSIIYYDIKLIDGEQHEKETGATNSIILENLQRLCKLPGTLEKITVRIPCIPGVNNSKKTMTEINDFITKLGIQNIEILPYNIMAGEKYLWTGRPYPMEKGQE